MAPNVTESPYIKIPTKTSPEVPSMCNIKFKTQIIWPNVITMFIMHLVALVIFIIFPYREHKMLMFCWYLQTRIAGFGLTAGVHRYWCHRSYKAKLPLRIILSICYAMTGQNRITYWVRDHRVHHKYSDTDADPYNASRGFFFSHVGWLMMKRHPEVRSKSRTMDIGDLFQDPVVVFHEKHFVAMKILWCFAIPTVVPCLLWNESLFWSFMVSFNRYVVSLNATWLVNSAAHMFGNKPYDRRIRPTQNLSVSILTMGEGWHNYHHTFPWDYKASELGNLQFNMTTMLLDFFGKIGWAYDMKTPSKELVEKILMSHGDGTHPLSDMIPKEGLEM